MADPPLDEMLRQAPPEGSLASRRALAEIESELFDRPPRPLTLSRYVLLDRLGAGGVGVVYRAYDPQLDRKVAIKLLRSGPRGAARDTDGRLRLLREAQALAQLAHPNVIGVHDVGTYNDDDLGGIASGPPLDVPARGVFVVMELVDGPTLRQWLTRERHWTERLAVLRAAAAGLVAAHVEGLVHRDFKPENVLVGDDGRVRVLDFGLARATGDDSGGLDDDSDERVSSSLETRLTATGTVMGTPLYMAPEQHLGAAADERSDQFSFCVCLYEALFRVRPYSGDTLEAVALAKQAGPRPPPSKPRVSARVRAAVIRGLSVAPRDRFATMSELLEELDAARAGRRRMLLVGSIMGLAAAGAVMNYSSTDGVDPCSGHATRLEGTWDAPRKAAMRDAFLATDVGVAAHAWERFSASVDAYIAGWVELRTGVCRAALRGEVGPVAMEGHLRCFDRRLAELGEMLDVFAEPSETAVRNAPTAATQLSPLAACMTGEDRPEEELPPPGPKRDAAIEVEADVGRAVALLQAGRGEDANELLVAAVERATDIGHPPTLVSAQTRLAVCSLRRGRLDDASAQIHAALVAAERSGQRALIDGVLVAILNIDGSARARHVEADRLVDVVEARFEHSEPSPRMRASFHLAVSLLRTGEGRYEEALDHVPPRARGTQLIQRRAGRQRAQPRGERLAVHGATR